MHNIDLTPILQAIVALIAALITAKLIPWIKARTTNEQRAAMSAVIKTLVFAAEQMYGACDGAVKLRYVEEELEKRGYKADTAAIEAVIGEYINFGRITGAESVREFAAEEDETEE